MFFRRTGTYTCYGGGIGSCTQTIYTMLNNADLRFPNVHDENGEEIELTKGRFIQLMESRNRDVRKEALRLCMKPMVNKEIPLLLH